MGVAKRFLMGVPVVALALMSITWPSVAGNADEDPVGKNITTAPGAQTDAPFRGEWQDGSPMTIARRSHTATHLLNNRVLVAGGQSYDSTIGGVIPISSAEIYYADRNRWRNASPMSVPRAYHTATALPDGRVLVTGGYHYPYDVTSSTEIYDPALDTWASAGMMSAPRQYHTATMLRDGRVLVVGGNSGWTPPLSSTEIYNPATNSWSPAGSMSEARLWHSATALPDGRVLVAGGRDSNNQNYSSGEVYDPISDLWSSAGSMSVDRCLHTATLLPSGELLVAGGRGTPPVWTHSGSEVYFDMSRWWWTLAGSLNESRGFHTATPLSGGRVLVAGGFEWKTSSIRSSAEVFSPSTRLWSRVGSLRLPRIDHAATDLEDGRVMVTGGEQYVFPYAYNEVEIFKPYPN